MPFFVLWFIFGKDDYYFQLFVVFDTMRLFLYDRYIKLIKTELTNGIARISMFMVGAIMLSSILIQFIENEHRYSQGNSSGHEANSENIVENYDMMLNFTFF